MAGSFQDDAFQNDAFQTQPDSFAAGAFIHNLTIANWASAGNSGPGISSITIPSATAGNVMLVIQGTRGADVTASFPTVPSGFTRLGYWNGTQTSRGVTLDAKTAVGGETSISLSGASSAVYYEVRNLTSPYVAQASATDFANDTTPALGTLTFSDRDSLVIAIQWKQPASPNPGPSTISGYTAGPDTGYAQFGNRHRLTSWWTGRGGGTYGGDNIIIGSTDGSEDGVTVNIQLVDKGVTGSFVADAYIYGPKLGSFTADAVIVGAQSGSFTADAVVSAATTATLLTDAIVRREAAGSFTADAVFGSVTTVSDSFTADAFLDPAWGAWSLVWSNGVVSTYASALAANAVLLAPQSGSLSADAAVVAATAGSFAADAIVTGTQTGSFTADSVLLAPQSGSLSADAVVASAGTGAGSFTADAVIRKVLGETTSSDYVRDDFTRTHASSWQDADVGGTWSTETVTDITYSTDGDEAIRANGGATPRRARAIVGSTGVGNREFVARIKATELGTTTRHALLVRLRRLNGSESPGTGGDGYIGRFSFGGNGVNNSLGFNVTTSSTGIPIGSVVTSIAGTTGYVWCKVQIEGISPTNLRSKIWDDGTPEPDWQLDIQHSGAAQNTSETGVEEAAVFWMEDNANTPDWYIDHLRVTTIPVGELTFTADAVITSPSFTADAIIAGTGTGSFTADAEVVSAGTGAGSFTADAVIAKLVWSDTFTRTVASGWGEPYVNFATYPTSVDGSAGLIAAGAGAYNDLRGFPFIRTGIIQFDYYIPANVSDIWPSVFAEGANEPSPFGVEVYSNGDGTYGADTYLGSLYYEFTPDPSTWYTFKWYIGGEADGSPMGVKVWKTSDPEPAAWGDEGTRGIISFWTSSALYVFAATAEAGRLDNLYYWSTSPSTETSSGFTADAVVASAGTGAGSFTADAVIAGAGTGSFTAKAIIYLGTTSGGDGGQSSGTYPPTTIGIVYDDVSLGLVDITADVDIASAEFVAMTNGNTGTARIRVRDTGHGYTFTTGRSLTLTIDGRPFWGGFVMQARKAYPFPVDDTTVVGETPRYWDLTAFDYAFLFERRIVYSATNPLAREIGRYPAGTYDDTIINDIFDNYLPGIVDDGLSRAGVERVDIAILDIPNVTSTKGGSVASTGFTWRQMMDQVTRATGAVYYIDPDRVLHYTDVDTADAAYALTDNPTYPVHVGYQKFALNYNGANLINDYWLWGAALGSAQMVYAHRTSPSSIAEHGTWQAGNFSGQMYRQTSVDLSASTAVNGTPQNKRGHKDDAVSFTCTVFHPVFRLGEKVEVTNSIYGFSDVLPIRMMRITFANPQRAVFELTLSHAIDDIWSTFESRFPPLVNPPGGGVPPPKPPPPCTDCDPCTDAVCGITDTFTREVIWTYNVTGVSTGTYAGTADAGDAWEVDLDGEVDLSVTGGQLKTYLYHFSGGQTGGFALRYPATVALEPGTTKAFVFRMDELPQPGAGVEYDYLDIRVGLTGAGIAGVIIVSPGGTTSSYIGYVAGGSTSIPNAWWQANQTYTVTMVDDGSGTTMSVSDGTTTYSHTRSPAASNTTIDTPFIVVDRVINIDQNYVAVGFYIDDIDIPEVNRCSAGQFDDFNRTVASGWGTATDGHTWSVASAGSGVTTSVDGASAVVVMPTTSSLTTQIMKTSGPGPWSSGSFTMRSRVYMPDSSTGIVFYCWSVSANQWLYMTFYTNTHPNTLGVSSNVGGEGDSVNVALISGGVSEWVNFKWEHDEGTLSRAKAWLDGDVEPDWQVTRPSLTGAPVFAGDPEFRVSVSKAISGVQTTKVDYIEFDYDGKPCYSDACTPVSYDQFARVTATGWGTAPSGLSWSRLGPGASTASTDGSVGIFKQGQIDIGNDGIIDINYGSGQAYMQIGGTATDNPWSGSNFSLEARFRYTSLPDPGVYYAQGALAVRNSDFTGYTYDLGLIWQHDTGNSYFGVVSGDVATGDRGDDSIAWSWAINTWYLVKLTRAGTVVKGKIWVEGNSEPDWQVQRSFVTNFTADALRVGIATPLKGGTANPDVVNEFELDYIDVCSGLGGAPVPIPPGVPTSGYVCEDLSYTNGYTYQASNSYQSGTSEVWVNGLRVVHGSNGYTENYVAGTITFSTQRNSNDIVRVCYQANGSL